MSQSLAGRIGRVELLPLSLAEMQDGACLPPTLDRLLLNGGYPAIYQRDLAATDWFPNYVATYLERDVRQIIAVRDLSQFQRFVRMGADCGISAVTAREWLSVMEASYPVPRLPPYFQKFGKRLLKSPKLYFLDVGLMAWLLGIRDEQSMATHAARGALFETWVVSEMIKQRFNAGQPADLYFWRDSAGHEIDVVFETPTGLQAVEIKSGSTFASDWTDGLKKWQKITGDTPTLKPILIYGGMGSHEREHCFVRGWQEMAPH